MVEGNTGHTLRIEAHNLTTNERNSLKSIKNQNLAKFLTCRDFFDKMYDVVEITLHHYLLPQNGCLVPIVCKSPIIGYPAPS